MHVADAEAERQAGALLVGPELHVGQTFAAYRIFDFAALRAAADEHKCDRLCFARQALRRGEDGVELMHAAHVARIADDEFVREPPFASQRIVRCRNRPYRVHVRPIWNHADVGCQRPRTRHHRTHALAQHHVCRRRPERRIAQAAQQPRLRPLERAHAQRLGHLRKHVLHPVDELGATPIRDDGSHHRDQRRIGLGDHHVARARAAPQPPTSGKVEGGVIQRAPEEPVAAEARSAHAQHLYTVDVLAQRQDRCRVIVALAARDHANFKAGASQKKSQIGKHLARRRMIGVEVAVEENDSHGAISMTARL